MSSVQDLIGFFGGPIKPIKPFRQGGNVFADLVGVASESVSSGVKQLAAILVPPSSINPLDDVSLAGKQEAPLEHVPVVSWQSSVELAESSLVALSHLDTSGAVKPMAGVTLQNGAVDEAVSSSPKMGGSDSLAGERVASVAPRAVVSLQSSVELAGSSLVALGHLDTAGAVKPMAGVTLQNGAVDEAVSTSPKMGGSDSLVGERAASVARVDISVGCVNGGGLGYYSKDQVFASLTAEYREVAGETVYGLGDQTKHHYQDRSNWVGETVDCVVLYHLEVTNAKINQYHKIDHYLGKFEAYLCGDKSLFRRFKTFWSSLIDSHRKRVSYTWLNNLVFQSQRINTSLKKMVAGFSYALSIINLNNIRVYSKRVGIDIDVESRMKTQTEVQDNLYPSDQGEASSQNRDLFRNNGEEALFIKLITNTISPWELALLNSVHAPSEASSTGLMDCTAQPDTRDPLRPTQYGLTRPLLGKSSRPTKRSLVPFGNGKENLWLGTPPASNIGGH